MLYHVDIVGYEVVVLGDFYLNTGILFIYCVIVHNRYVQELKHKQDGTRTKIISGAVSN